MTSKNTGRCPAVSLKHLASLQLEPNLSCYGNHPDLESRLTQEEKWVLASFKSSVSKCRTGTDQTGRRALGGESARRARRLFLPALGMKLTGRSQ